MEVHAELNSMWCLAETFIVSIFSLTEYEETWAKHVDLKLRKIKLGYKVLSLTLYKSTYTISL